MAWTRFDDRRPSKGAHIFAITKDRLWWGFYNPSRVDGDPGFVPTYWIKVDPLPMFPQEQVEVLPPTEESLKMVEELKNEAQVGQEDEKTSWSAPKKS